jgi:hypothetical protein
MIEHQQPASVVIDWRDGLKRLQDLTLIETRVNQQPELLPVELSHSQRWRMLEASRQPCSFPQVVFSGNMDPQSTHHYFENAFPWQRPWPFPPEPLGR